MRQEFVHLYVILPAQELWKQAFNDPPDPLGRGLS